MAKSSAYPPLDGLVDLACRDGVDIRPTLLRVLTDLYVQKPVHSDEEETQYVELARGLIDVVDATTLAVVADKLSAYPGAPAAILDRLGLTLVPQAAPRSKKSATPRTVRAELLEVFFAAGSDERRLILVNLDAAAEIAPRQPASGEVIRRLENAALQRNPGEFARTLERALGIGHTLAERVARDPSGEPIVIAARALGMSAAVLHRVLLFLNPAIGQSVERVYDLARLYDDLTPAAAEHMLAIWRQASGKTRPSHETLHWDDERRDARSLSTPARYRSDRGRVMQPSRVKTGGK
ncbi:MAG TPA: DUF2336 domain-containing protein [Pseudolabrys sp.]|nr:DUF2336 domain-containing protein [Pseudolabrys sp.]